ncbi:MAG: glycosyltransferase family 39 protein [Anaerolineae bacterium]|nr:glycosyltransferase family 39 protein [Anaerolineae bacterium]
MTLDTPAQEPNDLTRLDWAILAGLVAVAVVVRLVPGLYTIDDAFITFRYARNIVDGVGFVYNPGEHVLGTTTPLFTIVLALASALTGSRDFPYLAAAISIAADAVTCILLYLTGRRLTGSRFLGAALGLLWAVATLSAAMAVIGMETCVYVMWIVAALYAYSRERDHLTMAAAALATLTRPDALIWVVPLLAHYLWVRRRTEAGGRRERLAWLVYAAVLAPWLIFSLIYFGNPLPHSILAKSSAYQVPPFTAFGTLWRSLVTPFFEQHTLGIPFVFVGSFLYPMLYVAGALSAARRMPRLLPFFTYPVLYLAAFSISNPPIFRWYLTPPLAITLLGITAGVWYLAGAVGGSRARWVQPVVLAAGLVIAGVFLSRSWQPSATDPARLAPDMTLNDQEIVYARIGQRLAAEFHVDFDTVVATSDIGALGYYSGATILDTVGLVSPASSDYYPAPSDWIEPGQTYALPPAVINDGAPDYVVVMEIHARHGLLHDATFNASYTLLWKEPTTIFDTDGILIFARHRNDE